MFLLGLILVVVGLAVAAFARRDVGLALAGAGALIALVGLLV